MSPPQYAKKNCSMCYFEWVMLWMLMLHPLSNYYVILSDWIFTYSIYFVFRTVIFSSASHEEFSLKIFNGFCLRNLVRYIRIIRQDIFGTSWAKNFGAKRPFCQKKTQHTWYFQHIDMHAILKPQYYLSLQSNYYDIICGK